MTFMTNLVNKVTGNLILLIIVFLIFTFLKIFFILETVQVAGQAAEGEGEGGRENVKQTLCLHRVESPTHYY